MSAQTTLSQLSTSGEAIVNFIINNNPAGVQSQMDSIQLLPPDMTTPTYDQLKAAVMDLVKVNGQKAKETFEYVLSVDYVDEGTGPTNNLRAELEEGVVQSVGEGGRGSIWVSIVDGVFDLADSVFGFLSLQQQTEISGNVADAAQADYKRNTLFGIPKEVLLALIAVVGLVALVTILKPKKG
jgi:hypothetical protein